MRFHEPLPFSLPLLGRRRKILFLPQERVHNGIVGAIREHTHRVVLVAILSCIEREYLVLHVLIKQRR